jgi:hypothetical protein
MAKISNLYGRTTFDVERFDGGLNTTDAPSKISPFESPDCLNVVFDTDGAIATRDGTAKWNTTSIGTCSIDHGISYNNDMIVWANGKMWKNSSTSGTTFTAITSSSGHFQTGATVAAVVYQNVLFCSDGVNGPWKYSGSENFYNMGIDIPSAPTGSSIGAGSVATGTYYYAVSFVNTQVVEGQLGSASVGVVLTNSSTVRLTSIPVGSTLAGVSSRFIYRGDNASGPFRKVGTISDNTTATFDDTTANGSEGRFSKIDGTKPKAFNTIELHQDRLFFDDFDDTTFIRYTNFQEPYIAEAENEEPMNQGDGFPVQAISAQDNFVTIFKKNKSFSIEVVDASDDLTWIKRELAGNIGIVGPKAVRKVRDGTIFVGMQNGRITGFHFLTGIRLIETSDGNLRSLLVSKKIEYSTQNALATDQLDNFCLELFDNRLYAAHTSTGQSVNDKLFWLDLNRVGTSEQPGSWSLWDGINAKCLFAHDGKLFAGDSGATGFVRKFNSGSYSDSGSAINSYFWTKEFGGETDGSLDSYAKNLRDLYLWYSKLGSYYMNVRVRLDGDTSTGAVYPISLANTSSLWDTALWDVGTWSSNRTDFQSRIPINGLLGRRFQIRFDNQNTAGQGFKVHRLELEMLLRGRRR